MNKVIIMGNITNDPEVKAVGETSVTEFGVAVNRRYKKNEEWVEAVEFLNIKCWGSRGEAIANHLEKGSKVLLEGEIRTDTWEKDGEKKYKTYILVNNWEFCEKKGS